MDQALKQRVVGALVITALAAIFVPMLFNDPVDETGKKINELQIPPLPPRLEYARSVKLPASTEDVIKQQTRKPITGQAKIKETEAFTRWFLQVGVFSQENNAIALQNELRSQGFAASVLQAAGEAGVMYRVRVGPEVDRKMAEKIKLKLKQLNNLDSFIAKEEDK